METSSRRKACDTCYNKKIKCDLVKPVCSNCQLYKVQCVTTTVRRRTVPSKGKAVDTLGQVIVDSGSKEGIEARLERIESKLDMMNSSNGPSLETLLGNDYLLKNSNPTLSLETPSTSDTSSTYSPKKMNLPNLPPLNEILPIVEIYFQAFNIAIPLFHQPSFLKMIRGFYAGNSRDTKVTWAAINAVMAIGYQMKATDSDAVRFTFAHEKSLESVRNINKALDDIILRDEDTLGIQVILALVIVYQATSDPKPASVLISTAVRQVHRMQLHTRDSDVHFSPEESKHRRNVFWICYILDKEMSMRSKTPSAQLDSDVDLDLPQVAADESEGEGVLKTVDGSTVNFFRTRVLLAHIQGKIYDNLYSTRSSKLSAEERRQQVMLLDRMLDEWRLSIPRTLTLEQILTEPVSKVHIIHTTLLQHTYLLCLVYIHGLYSMEAQWMKSIDVFSRVSLENFDNNVNICTKHMLPPRPTAWAKCVKVSRGSLRLFTKEPHNGGDIWLNVWSYFSGLIILLTNIIYVPTATTTLQDQELAKEALLLFSQSTSTKPDAKVHDVISILFGLEKLAGVAMNISRARGDSPVDLSAYEEALQQAQPPLHHGQSFLSQNTLDQVQTSMSGDWVDQMTFDNMELVGFHPFDDAFGNVSVNEFDQH